MTLDDIRWRQGCLRIHQRKISSPLELPLTNEVSTALVKHLKRAPPPAPYRQVFRSALPSVCSSGRSSGEFFTLGSESDLRSPSGCTLSASLSSGLSPKERNSSRSSAMSSGIVRSEHVDYLQLATEDLREVSLPVPGRKPDGKEGQQ